jgi:hypothetical protein
MEVHHHPDLHHKKKHLKEYFLEFLMIFLAVTMGFFAESYREHLVEMNKEKQFIFSMIEDLKSDTSAFHQYIDNWYENTNQIDTLVGLLNSSNIENKTGQIYTLERVATRNFARPFYNSRTFEQMKNSGNLTLIKEAAIANSITKYYNSIRRLDDFRTIFGDAHEQMLKDEHLIFDSYILFQTRQKRPYKLLPINGNPPFTKYDSKDFNQYLARLNRYYTLNLVILEQVENNYLPATKRLLFLLQATYGNE